MTTIEPQQKAARGCHRRSAPLAVIDIGSNSIRLVVYSGLERGAGILFNEKVLCGLGRGLAQTGHLNPDGIVQARRNLVRFTRLATAMGAWRIDLLATAAVREASDGPAFAAEVEDLCGFPVKILSGYEEGRLSALGVIAGSPGACGVMGDLGGGSLELVEICHGQVGRSATLPFGPLHLMERYGREPAAIAREVDRHLSGVPWLSEARDAGHAAFFAVGGAWRNLARIHIEQSAYPLRVLHGYSMSAREAESLTRVVGRLGRRSLARIKGVTAQRLDTLPAAAIVLRRVVRALKCREVRISAYGLREGHAYGLLSEKERARDPLIAVCHSFARRETHFDAMGGSLMAWTDPLFPQQPPAGRRLRHASCLLSDIAWREYADYRANEAFFRILHYPFVALDHADRVYLAYAAYTRYGGSARSKAVAPYLGLLTDDTLHEARVLGLAQRLAYRVSGATSTILARCGLDYRKQDGFLGLLLPDDGSVPPGEAVERDLRALGAGLGITRLDIAGEAISE